MPIRRQSRPNPTDCHQRSVALYWRSRAWRTKAAQLAFAAFDGAWLGALDRPALQRIATEHYHRHRDPVAGAERRYVDPEHLFQGLHPWEARLVDEFLPAGARVVVTGAGAGREVDALLERGYDAHGYEPNAAIVAGGRAALRPRGRDDHLHEAPADMFPPGLASCDGVLVGWGMYMHVAGRWRRVAFLRGARAVLPVGAPLIVSFYDRRDGPRFLRLTAVVAQSVRRVRRAASVEVGDTLSPEFVHLFTKAEIEWELRAAGFELIRYARAPYGHAVARAA